MASLLVIGGSGFFGKSIADAYARQLFASWGIERLLLVARSVTALAKNHPELVTQGVELIDLDIAQTSQLPWADYVIHAAASTDARKYRMMPEVEKANLIAATKNFCRLAPHDLVGSRIVYTSSGAVYGTQDPSQPQFPEDMSLNGSIAALVENKRDYALAKRESELMIARLGRRGMDVSIARCFTFVGPYLPRNQHFAVGNFLDQGFSGQAISVKASSPVVRSYLYADDLVIWLMNLVMRATPVCPIWNIGSPEAIKIQDLAMLIAERFGVSVDTLLPQSKNPIDYYVPSVDRALAAGMKYLKLGEVIDQTIKRIYALNKQFSP